MTAWPDRTDTCTGDVLRDMHRPTQSQPADPTGITGATAKMLGLGVTFTPVRTNRVMIWVSATAGDDTNADTATFILRYGTSTAPANGAASTGTAGGIAKTFTALTGLTTGPMADVALISGLTAGTAYWFDYSAKATGGGAIANITGVNMVIMEV